MNKLTRKKRVSKFSLLLKNKQKIKNSNIKKREISNSNLNLEIEEIKKEIIYKKDNLLAWENKNHFLSKEISDSQNVYEKEKEISENLKKDMSIEESKLSDLDNQISKIKFNKRRKGLELNNLKKEVSVFNEKNTILIKEKELIDDQVYNLKNELSRIKKTSNIIDTRNQLLLEEQEQMRLNWSKEGDELISLNEIVTNLNKEKISLEEKEKNDAQKLKNIISQINESSTKVEELNEKNKNLDNKITLKLDANKKYLKEIEILKFKLKKEEKVKERLDIAKETALEENDLLKNHYVNLKDEELKVSKEFHNLLDSMDEVSEKNEENLEKLIQLQDDNDNLFIKDSFVKIKKSSENIQKNLNQKTEDFKSSFRKIKDKMLEDIA